ncbi:hypothetical protein PSHI8_09180 [Polynucleobacter sp. SHI8]|uniref:YybH family protein n=1 Tax=unclassified Polynucleobacter TaxID=2640945 RepID=UPI002491CCEB|nr:MULTISPECIES: SgcJ/EcaC family oxidoreductase [unclassified Polynucleobacter]BDW10836.1 hypothetical protein PSHI2_09180 [Polynucleobacter sp. SHI2]BDW13282.1 hypothetical protein PSHI8_09180 [Polynucleobacter sp. SHI8]
MNRQTDQAIVAQVYEQWQQHFAPLNSQSLANLYAEDAVLFGSRIPPYIGRTAIQSYFENLPPELFTGVVFTPEYIKRVTPDVISIAGSANFQRSSQTPLELRITHVLVYCEDQWQIVSHHVSSKQNL